MYRYVFVVLCFPGLFAMPANAQKTTIEPLSISAGTVLTFHLQTRLNPSTGNELDALPKGTLIRVKMANAVDSAVDRDGSAFRGALISSIVSGKEVIFPAGSEARGLLVVLRSQNHPEGFRYELLITKVVSNDKSLDLTASLSASLVDSGNEREASRGPEPAKNPEGVAIPPAGKVPASN